jgi:sec-independent protein translocase protein TatC
MAREEGSMTLLEHLDQLRIRLTRAVLALVAGAIVSSIFTRRILAFLIAPLKDTPPVALAPTTTMVMFFKVALIGGAILAMPAIVYQVISFVVPGLTVKERRYLWIVVPGATACFLTGAAFAYFVMLRAAIPFMQGFLADLIEPNWAIDKYISLITALVFWVGVSFEMPLIMAFLARLGILKPKAIIRFWRYAIVIIAVISAAITPTVDPLNMALVMLPLIGLYGLGILLATLAYRARSAPAEEAEAETTEATLPPTEIAG